MIGFFPRPVLTLDIVGFSLMSNDEQMNAIKLLIQMLNQAIPQEHNHDGARIWSPAGDGGSITFLKDIGAALTTAIYLGKIVNDYNTQTKPTHPFLLRMGLHSGTVTKEVDFDNRENIWGQGMNISARVMSLAKPGQILASKEFVEQADLHRRPEPEVVSIGKWWAKHHKSLELYNIFIEGAGIPPSEVDVWFGPLHYPLQQAIDTYEAMLEEQAETGPAFRIAMLAKRLIDLDPHHTKAEQMLDMISLKRSKPRELAHAFYDEFFSHLSPGSIRHFFQNAEFKAFEKDQLVTEEGQPADSMMIVASGELSLSIRLKGKPFQEMSSNVQKSQPADFGLTFGEGAIIGEMGLFSPGGKRTATLRAIKNTITLTLDYRFLKLDTLGETLSSSKDSEHIIEIRERIWDWYCQRMIRNHILSHRLFQRLTNSEREELSEKGEVQPSRFDQSVQLTRDDVWNYWTIIVSGTLTAFTDSEKTIVYGPGDCLGPISLVRDHNPFTRIEVTPKSHLIRFPFHVMSELIDRSPEFRQDCYATAGEDEWRDFGVRVDIRTLNK